jgi:drug/metabolite transporter (DMT)-like permease
LLGGVAIAAFFGTYLAIWLQQTALKYAPAGVAQALLATSPIFVLPLLLALKERVSLRAALGALVALAGIWLLF